MLVVVPREFADALVRRSGDVGRRWVEAVPALAERYSWTAAGLFPGWACSMRPKSPAI